MAGFWSRVQGVQGIADRPDGPITLVPAGAADDVTSAARTWLRLSWLAALPGLNPLWWLGTAYSAVAAGRARTRPFSAEDRVRVARRLLLAGQALTAAVATAAAVGFVVATGAPAAAIAAGPFGATIAILHAGAMGAGTWALTWLLRVAVPPLPRRGDAVAARAFLVLIGVTWAAPIAAASLVSALA